MVFRIFLIGVTIALVFWAVRVLMTPRLPRKNGSKDEKPQERMIQCAHCGLHVPESEAIQQDGKSYCSVEHRDQQPPR